MSKIMRSEVSAPKQKSSQKSLRSKGSSEKGVIACVEAQALLQLEAALPKIKGYIEKLAEIIKSDKLDPQNSLYKQTQMVDENNCLIPNTPNEQLLSEFSEFGYEILDVLREFKHHLNLTEIKISTSNDMTMQARASLLDETGSCMMKAAEFTEMYFYYYAKYRVELGRRWDTSPAIHPDLLNCIAVGERQTVQDLRYKVRSFKYQLESMVQVWESNKESICKIRTDERMHHY